MTKQNGRPKAPAVDHRPVVQTKVADWADTYRAARYWVAWTARRRWPDHAANDAIWALSVADWWHGPGRGGRDG